jgi:hypothetical protein
MYANTFSHSQTINHYITYSVISSEPALTYTSVVSTIRCYAITSGDLEGSTYVEYTGNFSSDADAGKPWIAPITCSKSATHTNNISSTGVIQDAKFKRREALADLAKAASKQ